MGDSFDFWDSKNSSKSCEIPWIKISLVIQSIWGVPMDEKGSCGDDSRIGGEMGEEEEIFLWAGLTNLVI